MRIKPTKEKEVRTFLKTKKEEEISLEWFFFVLSHICVN